MPVGKVKWFDAKKGYGFIADNEGNDVFVHYSVIKSKRNYKTLEDGAEVEYDVKDDGKGKRAEFVRVIE